LNYGDHGEVTESSSFNEFDESDELCARVGSGGVQDEVSMVQDLLLAAILDGHEHLASHLLLLED
jgi:hypothetical protein